MNPQMIDPDIRRFAIVNMTSAILSTHAGLANADALSKERNIPLPTAAVALATDFAMAALMEAARFDTFQLPAGGAVSDALQLFIEGSNQPGRREFEDGLQEGELTGNAVALLTNDPSLWTSDAQDGSEVPFPGTGEEAGNGRINDLVRAAAYVLAEIERLQRAQARDDHYALANREAAGNIAPPVDALANQDSAGEADTETMH